MPCAKPLLLPPAAHCDSQDRWMQLLLCSGGAGGALDLLAVCSRTPLSLLSLGPCEPIYLVHLPHAVWQTWRGWHFGTKLTWGLCCCRGSIFSPSTFYLPLIYPRLNTVVSWSRAISCFDVCLLALASHSRAFFFPFKLALSSHPASPNRITRAEEE